MIFSTKRSAISDNPVKSGTVELDRNMEHKYIGMVLKYKLSHIKEVILQWKRLIRTIRCLFKHISRIVLD